jgi:hypothetical protein
MDAKMIKVQKLENVIINGCLQIAALQMEIPGNDFPMYVIYEKPLDFPNCFVVRRYLISRHGAKLTLDHFTAATLEDARNGIPFGLVRIERDPLDEPQIVESWI